MPDFTKLVLNDMEKFKKGDEVLKIGTVKPIMTIMGRHMKSGFPKYSVDENMWTCEWKEYLVFDRIGNFKESDLELYSKPQTQNNPNK